MATKLVLYEDYTREEVHNIFDPHATFTPQAGTWGLQGIIELPDRTGDYVFFVTFGQKQASHEFDEGITSEGVLRWQSQPKQGLGDRIIRDLISHDEGQNAIYLFLRTAKSRHGAPVPYTYLGRLKYIAHDRDRERPVCFTWQILEWNIPEGVRNRMKLDFEDLVQTGTSVLESGPLTRGLIQVPAPKAANGRSGLSSPVYAQRIQPDYAELDAKNRELGLAGEEAVLEAERDSLIAAGRPDLAKDILHVSKSEGDGAGYDIKSYTADGQEKFIEVKTTRGGEQTNFYLSRNELHFANTHSERYYLYRVFDFDPKLGVGKVFVRAGSLTAHFVLTPTQYKVSLLPTQQRPAFAAKSGR